MKQRNLLIILLMLVFATSCSTSRNGVHRRGRPDNAALGIQHQRDNADIGDGARRQRPPTWQQQLSVRLDSLLLDSLFSTIQAGVCVYDLTDDAMIYARGATQRLRPASTEKMVTAVAALDLLGPQYCFETRVYAAGSIKDGRLNGDLWFVGGMDPLFGRVDLNELCKAVRQSGIKHIDGRVMLDLTKKDEDKWGWGWCWDDDNPSLKPLLIDGKDVFADVVAEALKKSGIQLKSSRQAILSGQLPATASLLATRSRPLPAVLEPMMKQSNNLCAESVFYQMGTTRKSIVSTINDVISRAYAEVKPSPTLLPSAADLTQIADGSGLSLYNYQTPQTFIALLRHAAINQDIFSALWASLPIAAVDGTLRNRMASTPAANNVRAKTGTVTGVSTLVGYCTRLSNNHMLAFAIMTQGVQRGADGRRYQDSVCTLLCE